MTLAEQPYTGITHCSAPVNIETGGVLLHRIPINRRAGVIPRARATFTILSRLRFLSPRSIPPMYVQ